MAPSRPSRSICPQDRLRLRRRWITAQPWCDGGGGYVGLGFLCRRMPVERRPLSGPRTCAASPRRSHPTTRPELPLARPGPDAGTRWLWLLLVLGTPPPRPCRCSATIALVGRRPYLAHPPGRGGLSRTCPGFMGGGSEHFDRFVAHPFHDPFWHDQAFHRPSGRRWTSRF